MGAGTGGRIPVDRVPEFSRVTEGDRTSIRHHAQQREPMSASLDYWARASTAIEVAGRHDLVLEFEGGYVRYVGECQMLTGPSTTQGFECGNRP